MEQTTRVRDAQSTPYEIQINKLLRDFMQGKITPEDFRKQSIELEGLKATEYLLHNNLDTNNDHPFSIKIFRIQSYLPFSYNLK